MHHAEQIGQQREPGCSVPKGLAPAKMVDKCTRREGRPRESLVPGLEGGQCLVMQSGWTALQAKQRA